MPKTVRERQVAFREEWDGNWLRLSARHRGIEYNISDICENVSHYRMMKNILMNEINHDPMKSGPSEIEIAMMHGIDEPVFREERRPIDNEWAFDWSDLFF